MVATVSPGRAMKKSSSGTERPGVGPAVQVGPTESCCTAGTQTAQLPSPSTYRNGRSREAGVVGSVVYGGSGNDCGGAPRSPAKTWFQTPFVQPSRLLLRTRNCCCEPLMMVPPENCESAMNPPLAYDGGVQ